MSCLIIGDSIAQGVAEIRKDCISYTEVGISTIAWSKKWLEKIELGADHIFISLGSNDIYRTRNEVADELYHIRHDIGSSPKKVTWVLPAIKPWVQEIVMEVAAHHDDVVIQIKELSTDRVHPTGAAYLALSKSF